MPTDRPVFIEFSCAFQIKVMGAQHPEFETAILGTVRIYAPKTQSHHISTCPSNKDNYLGTSVNMYVTSQAQLNDVYRALASHEMVKVVLQGMKVIQKGLVEYLPIFRAMKAFNTARMAEMKDELWMVERSPMFTQGLANKPEHLLVHDDIPIAQIDRGGQITYHSPRQLVMYTTINFKRRKTSVRRIVSALESSIISTLSKYGIKTAADPDRPGVYVDGRKVASLGLRIKDGLIYHGLALNINTDLDPSTHINPYGYTGVEMVQIADFVRPYPPPAEVTGRLTGHLQKKLNSQAVAGNEGNGKAVWNTTYSASAASFFRRSQ